MVLSASDSREWALPDKLKTPADTAKHYYETIRITKAPKPLELRRYFRSTYDFSSPMRYKTVVFLEPRLAPVRYFRTINFGIPAHLRHKSTVYCDYRPRPCAYSETAWVFPKQGREIFTSFIEHQQLVDTTWYKSQVNIINETGNLINDPETSEKEAYQTMKSSGYATSSAESSSQESDDFSDQLQSPTYNNNDKLVDYYHRCSIDNDENCQYIQ